MYHHHHTGGTASQPKRRKKRPIHGVKTVEVTRGKSGYGFTISGQNPCVLSVIVAGSPADVAGLKSGDYLVSVGNRNVTKEPHDDVVRMVGMSTGTLVLQVAENYNSSDSSDDEYHHRHKARYPNRVRSRHASSGTKPSEKVLGEHNHRERHKTEYKHKDPHWAKHDVPMKTSQSRSKIHKPAGSENYYASSNSSHDTTPQFAGPLAIEKRGVSSRSNLHATPMMHHPLSKQAVVKTFSQSAHTVRHGNDNHRKDWQNRTSISPSLHGSFVASGISSFLKTSANQNHTNCADNAFLIADDEDGDDEESLLNCSFHDMRVVVGYIGSIEMPSDAHKPHIRVQSIRSAVRRLRVEQKIHTLVLMEVSQDGVKLTNPMGTTIAHYPAGIISFSGVCPDDKRFFGIVTLHSASDQASDNEEGSQEEEETSSSGSCHVFMVDPEMKAHNIHSQKAKDFGINCTTNADTLLCAEFPKSATPVIMSITNLYKDRPGASGENEVAFSQAFADPSRAPQRSSSNSSNSDSGLGFSREGPSQPQQEANIVRQEANIVPQAQVVQPSQENWSGETIRLDRGPVHHFNQPHVSPGVRTIPTPHKFSVQAISTAGDTSLTNGHHYDSDFSPMKPVSLPNKSQTHDSSTSPKHKDKHNNSHVDVSQKLPSKNMVRTLSQPDLKRPASAPFKQFSESSAFVNYQHDKEKVETVDMDDRLSPRAMLPPPFHQLRSPSAPPSVSRGVEHSDSDSNDFDFPANTSGMGSLIERFEQDHALRISSPANASRRFSEGFAVAQQVRSSHYS